MDGPVADDVPHEVSRAAAAAKRSFRVAFQGERGAFSEAAVLTYFGPRAEPLPCPTFPDVFDRLASGGASAAMVPVENSYAGDVGETYDLLRRHAVRIRGELQLPVRHCLLALPGTRLGDLRVVRSHPQALAQCREFLHRHGLIAEPAYDTAAAARQVAEAGRRDLGAIASHQAALHYGLAVLAEDIQDSAGNVTRFYHLERDEPAGTAPPASADPSEVRHPPRPQDLPAASPRPGHDGPEPPEAPGPNASARLVPAGVKTSLLFVGEDRPGALYRCLGAFARREINLTKLTARPEPSGSWQYMFFADLEGSLEEPRVQEAIDELRRQATYVRIMGSYRVWQVHDADAGH